MLGVFVTSGSSGASEVILEDRLLGEFNDFNNVDQEYFRSYALEYAFRHNYSMNREAIVEAIIDRYTFWPDPSDEWAVRNAFIQFVTDAYYTAPISLSAHLHSAAGSRTFMYVNNYNLSRTGFIPGWMVGIMAPPKTVKRGKVSKALDAKKKVSKGQRTIQKKKVRTSVHFRRPKTLKTPRVPKFPRKSAPARCKLDSFAIIKHPLTTESAMKKIEDHNTLVFIVDVRANKHQIRAAVKKLYNIEVQKINTLITPLMEKKAYIRLTTDYDALDCANKIGII
ncbi:unnamed protein product [Heligmosomoides polygyrus]|uniref:Ribosomal_L23eN domain-containing protein n=1 Tax=Heligmosomoides polygyrus TaxID=6339 RepID=A0A183GX77_HELPZ|nr:unnamed protein product [Heligmosomoides polygyrus]